MNRMTVAAVQAEAVPGDVAGNARKGARLVAEAEGARVVVLPELFLSAYHPPALAAIHSGRTYAPARTVPSVTTTGWIRCGARLGTAVP